MMIQNAIEEKELKEHALSAYLPYVDVIENKIFFDNNTAGVLIELELIYDDMFDNIMLLNIKEGLNSFLNALDMDLKVQLIFKKTQDFDDVINGHLNENISNHEIVKTMFKKRVDLILKDIKRHHLFQYSFFIIFKKNYNLNLSSVKTLTLPVSRMNRAQDVLTQNVIQDLNEIQGKYKVLLEKIGFNVSVPTESKTLELIAAQINRTIIKGIEFETLDDLIYSDMAKTWDHLYINKKFVRMITFRNNHPPEYVYPTMIKLLQRAELNFEYDIIVNLRMLDKEVEKGKLSAKRNITKGFKVGALSGSVNADQSKAESNMNSLLDDITDSREFLFDIEFVIVVTGNTLKELNKNCQNIMSSLILMEGARGYQENCGNFLLYKNASLAGNIDLENARSFKFKSSVVSDLLPIYGPPKGVGEPLFIIRNAYGSLTYFNPFSDKFINKNGIVIGASGSGKSFLMNNIILSYLAKNPIIIIVDIGGSYKKMIETFKGDYFEMTLEYSINPFDISGTKREFFWNLIIQSMIRDETRNGISNDHKVVIERVISKIKKLGIEKPIISDFVDELKKKDFFEEETSFKLKEIQDEICRHLERWTFGDKGKFFNQRESTINTSSEIIGFDLKGMENYPDMLEIFMFYITNLFWEKAELYPERYKLYILDEMWKQLLTEQGQKLTEEAYRTLRKMYASIWSVTQGISEIADSKIRSAILDNISFTYILKHSDGSSYDKLMNVLNLTPKDIEEIKKLESHKGYWSEAYLKTPLMSMIARITPSPFEYWLSTTDGKDIPVFRETLKEFNDDILATINFLAEKYPHGSFNEAVI